MVTTRNDHDVVSRLEALLAVLVVARVSLTFPTDTTVGSVHRTARAIEQAATGCGREDLRRAARELAEARPLELGRRLERTLTALRAAIADLDCPGRTILVVEDDAATAELHTSILTGRDRRITRVRTTAEARVLLAEREVALVVLDLALPGEAGQELLLQLNGQASRPIVIVCTGVCDGLAAAECYALGADIVLEKPFAPQVLAAAAAAQLQRASGSDPAAPGFTARAG
jgi:CheY-like chemotaxis protein